MKCVECKSEIVAGDLVVEEIVNDETLPLYHKECVEPVEFMNAVRRHEVNRVFVFQETFQQAVINDPDMTYEQKRYWLSQSRPTQRPHREPCICVACEDYDNYQTRR